MNILCPNYGNNLDYLWGSFFLLSLVIILYFLLYFENSKTTEEDVIKRIAAKNKLSIQEEKVLKLLVQGKSNQEIADCLFISVYTIKRHLSNIYKKTNMNKKQLIEKSYLKD